MDRLEKLQKDRRYQNGEKSHKEELFEIINEMRQDKQETQCKNWLKDLRLFKMSEDDFFEMLYERLPPHRIAAFKKARETSQTRGDEILDTLNEMKGGYHGRGNEGKGSV